MTTVISLLLAGGSLAVLCCAAGLGGFRGRRAVRVPVRMRLTAARVPARLDPRSAAAARSGGAPSLGRYDELRSRH